MSTGPALRWVGQLGASPALLAASMVAARTGAPRQPFRWLERLFFGLTCLLIGAAILASSLISERQTALSKVSRYSVTWLASQMPVEVTRLEAALAQWRQPGSGIDGGEIAQRLAAVRTQIASLSTGEAAAFVQSRPELAETAAALTAAIQDVQAAVDSVLPGQSTLPIVQRLSPLIPRLVALANAANVRSGELVAQDQMELGRLQYFLSAVIAGLIACGFIQLWLVIWQNVRLGRANRDVDSLVRSLQRQARELQAANARISDSMDEAVCQNRMLEKRDLELAAQVARFDAALNNMSQALCMVDEIGHLIVCNVRFLELWNLPAEAACSGTLMAEIFAAATAASRYQPVLVTEIWETHQRLLGARAAGHFFRDDEAGCAVAVAHEPMAGGGWVATYEDITERRRSEARIHFMAHHDALTSLPNRTLFKERLEQTLEEWTSRGEQAAVLYLDLDDFKAVNDTLGHPTGDRILEEIGRRLQSTVKRTDTVARLGGDEFAVIARGDRAGAEHLAKRLVSEIMAPLDIDGVRIEVGTSMGLAMVPADGLEAVQLLKCADMALYRAKEEGRGHYRFFEMDMDVQLRARRTIELALREAIETGGLALHYQPLLNLERDRIEGFEALLRWEHPVHGVTEPSDFIPIAENAGLIVRIGEWALRQACEDARAWPDYVTVAVNLSPWQFASPNLFDAVCDALERSGLPPHRLELEITESALIKDSEKVHAIMHRLRALGVGTALDDFGTGYSSLSYLRSFPFDKIKIDRCFVMEMQGRADCQAIVQSVAELATRLGMSTTAEGVETHEQLRMIRAAGCTQAQGYLIDAARPAEEVALMFSRPVVSLVEA